MNSKIKKLYLLACVFSVGLGRSEQDLPLPKIREPGDGLDISIRQELERATGLGVQWLTEQQNRDGSWGHSNTVETTALCAVAFASRNDPALTASIQSAMAAIRKSTPANVSASFSAIAWSALAARITGQQGCTAELSIPQIENPATALSAAEAALRREILLGLNSREPDELDRQASRADYTEASRSWEADRSPLLQLWLDARVINREGNGQLITVQGQRVDWRRIFAGKIISSQKIDPQGGGFWQAATPSETLMNTALAILISKEL